MAGIPTSDIQTVAYAQANSITAQAVNNANSTLSFLNGVSFVDQVGSFPPPAVTAGWEVGAVASQAEALKPLSPTLPGYDGIHAPGAPGAVSFTVPNIGTIPDLLLAEPTISLPSAPSTALPGAPGNSPSFNMPAVPSAPTLTLPDVPLFASVALPEAPLTEIPLFDAVADFGDVTAPTHQFEFAEREYSSELLDATKAKILYDITNGGYGIDDADERRLWDRAREREIMLADSRLQDLARTHAARGFPMPNGAFYAQQEAARQEARATVSTLSRDIMIKKADMYVENRRFMIEAATKLESVLINYYAGMAERALNAARLQVELGVAVFNAQVMRFQAKLDEYKTYASVFESRIRASLTVVEIYKAQVEGARLTVETQKLHADVYQTQINGINAMINLYKTQMEAAQIAANIEKLKLDAFRSEVEVYGEQVRAKAAEFSMFRDQIQGELAKVQVYDASVRAYGARIGALETKAKIADVTARTEIAQSSATLERYRTEMEAYKTEVGVATEKIRSTLQRYGSDLQAYATHMDAVKAGALIHVQGDDLRVKAYAAESAVLAERMKTVIDHLLKYMDTYAGASNESTRTLTGLGASWASAVTGLSATIETA